MSLRVGDYLICTKAYTNLLTAGEKYKVIRFFLAYSIVDVDGEERCVCKHTNHVLHGLKIIGVAKAV